MINSRTSRQKRIFAKKITDISPNIQNEIYHDYMVNKISLDNLSIKYKVKRNTLRPFFNDKKNKTYVGQENVSKIIDMYNFGSGSKTIAKYFNMFNIQIIRILRANNVTIRKNCYYYKYNKFIKEVNFLYNMGYSRSFISRKLNINFGTVKKCLSMHTKLHKKTYNFIDKYSPEIVINLIDDYNSGYSIANLFNKYNIENHNIINIIKINDDKIISIFRKANTYSKNRRERYDFIFTKKQLKELIDMYISKTKSIKYILEYYNLGKQTFYNILKYNNIKLNRFSRSSK